MFSSRQPSDLHPVLQEQCRQFIEACAEHGIEVIITSTLRDNEAQAALYSQGRSPTKGSPFSSTTLDTKSGLTRPPLKGRFAS